jgi:tRNA(Ile)-lysidine synthase
MPANARQSATPVDLLPTINEGGLLVSGRRVVVLLSGGRDSVCLLDLAARISGPEAVAAVHVNYGLREASDEDQRFCERLCERLGVRLEVVRPAASPKGNVQAWARQLRYTAAGELAHALGADVAAGHTATDQVETILYRLASSPSRRALLGMRPREPLGAPAARDGESAHPPGAVERWLVRPLLSVGRDDTASYCSTRGLDWREDDSNVSDLYARARVRRALVPALRSIHPAAEENVLALAETLRDEAEVLDRLVSEVLGDSHAVSLERLRTLPVALARLVVQRLADEAAGGPAPGTARRLGELLVLPDHGTAALDLPHGVRAQVERGMLRFRGRKAGQPARLRRD